MNRERRKQDVRPLERYQSLPMPAETLYSVTPVIDSDSTGIRTVFPGWMIFLYALER